MNGSLPVLVLLSLTVAMVSSMGFFMSENYAARTAPKGDWPDTFPKHPAGFNYKCRGRQLGQFTKAPAPTTVASAPVQQVLRDEIGGNLVPSSKAPATTHVITVIPTTHKPATTTLKPTTKLRPTTTLSTILTSRAAAVTTKSQKGTTFWIRTPTPPNAPNAVYPGAHSVGVPLSATVAVDSPFAPDAALDPLNGAAESDDFDIKTVGTPKPPRAVIDPDA
ncbi:unnamed protein product [Caenorhabditis sp. 36 PRJEB53466]|nr:unnamed protein product [Caenorhabditis sp. 36 PRJEB53466]